MMFTAVFYSLWGSSKQAAVGPQSVPCLLLGSAVAGVCKCARLCVFMCVPVCPCVYVRGFGGVWWVCLSLLQPPTFVSVCLSPCGTFCLFLCGSLAQICMHAFFPACPTRSLERRPCRAGGVHDCHHLPGRPHRAGPGPVSAGICGELHLAAGACGLCLRIRHHHHREHVEGM